MTSSKPWFEPNRAVVAWARQAYANSMANFTRAFVKYSAEWIESHSAISFKEKLSKECLE